MTRRQIVWSLVALAVAGVAVPASAAPDAAAIMRKAFAGMKSAKTYQARWLMIMSMGEMGSMTMNMDMKMTASGKAAITTTPAGKATGMMAMGAGMASSTAVSDGKTVTMYMKGMNAYWKSPAKAGVTPGMMGMMGDLQRQGVKFKYVGSQYVRGKKCHVIRVNSPLPPQVAGQGVKTDVQAFVDEATGRLRQIKSAMTMPGGMMGGPNGASSSGGKAKPMVMTNTMVLVSETVNAPIADSQFKFTPPPGAREMKGGPMGMGGMGGKPGGGGPPGPVR